MGYNIDDIAAAVSISYVVSIASHILNYPRFTKHRSHVFRGYRRLCREHVYSGLSIISPPPLDSGDEEEAMVMTSSIVVISDEEDTPNASTSSSRSVQLKKPRTMRKATPYKRIDPRPLQRIRARGAKLPAATHVPIKRLNGWQRFINLESGLEEQSEDSSDDSSSDSDAETVRQKKVAEEKKLRVREDALLKIIEEARIQKRDFNDFFKTRIVLYNEMLDETRISLVDLKT
ncbi:hypothetical protein ScPMuIL_006117 [Solemya velum]